MTTPAKMALDYIYDPLSIGVDKYTFLEWETRQTIISALKVLDEVQKYPVSSGSTWNDAVAHTINHLKQIAGE